MAGSNYARDYSYQPMGLQGGGASASNYAGASANVDLSKIHSTTREHSPKYHEQAERQMVNNAELEMKGIEATGQVMAAGAQALGQAEYGRAMADGMKATANAKMGSSALSAGAGILTAGIKAFCDENVKEDIQRLENATEMLKALRPVSFKYKDDFVAERGKKTHLGFIAQEYVNVLPDAVLMDPMSKRLCIDQVDVIALLVAGFQELSERIDRLHPTSTIWSKYHEQARCPAG